MPLGRDSSAGQLEELTGPVLVTMTTHLFHSGSPFRGRTWSSPLSAPLQPWRPNPAPSLIRAPLRRALGARRGRRPSSGCPRSSRGVGRGAESPKGEPSPKGQSQEPQEVVVHDQTVGAEVSAAASSSFSPFPSSFAAPTPPTPARPPAPRASLHRLGPSESGRLVAVPASRPGSARVASPRGLGPGTARRSTGPPSVLPRSASGARDRRRRRRVPTPLSAGGRPPGAPTGSRSRTSLPTPLLLRSSNSLSKLTRAQPRHSTRWVPPPRPRRRAPLPRARPRRTAPSRRHRRRGARGGGRAAKERPDRYGPPPRVQTGALPPPPAPGAALTRTPSASTPPGAPARARGPPPAAPASLERHTRGPGPPSPRPPAQWLEASESTPARLSGRVGGEPVAAGAALKPAPLRPEGPGRRIPWPGAGGPPYLALVPPPEPAAPTFACVTRRGRRV